MNWEETIIHIRKLPEYEELVEKAYFDEDLQLNISRFETSLEFKETLKILNTYAPEAKTILDIGCGNGISAICFAKHGYKVTAVEPDPSQTVGAGAVKILKDKLKIDNIEIYEDFAENIKFNNNCFDIVYARQAMHHANQLDAFVNECVRVLKPNGILLTIRDHVILNEDDKAWFLKAHPLHKFYGGENGFTAKAYKNAITKAGADILKELKYYDSVINYFPKTQKEIKEESQRRIIKQKDTLRKKLGIIANIPLVWFIYKQLSGFKSLDENLTAGRMYSYIASKK